MAAHVFPAIRGKMGSTEYYQASVPARDLARITKIARELEEWTDRSVFERFQRDIAIKRIRSEIVPYLVRCADRFFGAFIVVIYEPDIFEFHPVTVRGTPPGRPYRLASNKLGMLIVDGGSLVALDGQHRLVSFREVISDGSRYTGPHRDDVPNDELCVVFIKHESFEKTRRIFSKVNRHAKPTTAHENIITSEDDGYSIVTRWLVETNPPLDLPGPRPPFAMRDGDGEPIIDLTKSQLRKNSPKFTTLPHLYESVRSILRANGIRNFDEKHRVNRPPDDELVEAYKHAALWWWLFLSHLSGYRRAMNDLTTIPQRRETSSPDGLLFRPNAQVALVDGCARACERGVSLTQALRCLQEINWTPRASPLTGIIVSATGSKMKTRKMARQRAARLVEYLIAADRLSPREVNQLRYDLAEETENIFYRLPPPVC